MKEKKNNEAIYIKQLLEALKNKYNTIPLPAKASFWFMVSSVFQKAVGLFVIPLYTRLMLPEEYGKYAVFLSYYSIISVFTSLGLYNYVVNNGIIKFGKKKDAFVTSLAGLIITNTFIYVLLYLIFTDQWFELTGINTGIMIALFIECIFMPCYELWCCKLRFSYNYRPIIKTAVITCLLIPAISLPLIILSYDKGAAAIWGRVIGYSVIGFYALVKLIKSNATLYKKSYWYYALKFNLPLIPHFLASILLNSADKIMVERLCGADKAGIYSLAFSLSLAFQFVNQAINSSLVPYIYLKLKNNTFDGIKEKTTKLLIGIAILNIFLMLVAPELILILGTEKYLEACYIVPSVAIVNILLFIFNLFVNVEYFYEDNKYIPVVTVFCAAFSITVNYIAIPKFGYLVAGYTTLFTYLLYVGGHYFLMKRTCYKHRININQMYDVNSIIKIIIGIIFLSFIILSTYNYEIIRYLLIFVMLICSLINKNSRLMKKTYKG